MGHLVTGSSHYLMEIALKNSLYLEPLCPYTQALLSTIPSSDPRILRRRIILKSDVPSLSDRRQAAALRADALPRRAPARWAART
jgi:ABC-type oligopeptide transport system ATPase subunit